MAELEDIQHRFEKCGPMESVDASFSACEEKELWEMNDHTKDTDRVLTSTRRVES